MARRLGIALVAAAIALAIAGPSPNGVVHATGPGASDLVWTFDVVNHLDNVAVAAGCAPTIYFAGLKVDAQGNPVVAWQQSGCGVPNATGADAQIRVARRLPVAGAWSVVALSNAACGGAYCYDRGRPAMALHPDGRPFLLFTGPGSQWSLGLRGWDASGQSGDSVLLELTAPPNDVRANIEIAADFPSSAAPGALPDRIRLAYPGDIFLNGDLVAPAAATLWSDYASGLSGGHHVALYGGGAVKYWRQSTGGLVVAIPAPAGSNGGSIAVSADGRRHIAHADPAQGLMHAWSDDGIAWQSEVVDAALTQKPALAIDADGNPAIAYWTGGGQDLWLARQRDGVWTTALVSTTPAAESQATTRLAFDADGRPVVAYYSNASQDVIVATGAEVPATTPPALSVTTAGSGHGTVTTTSGGSVTLVTATPEPGFRFVGWTGACTGSGPCIVTRDGAKSVAAIFHPLKRGATIYVTTTAESPGADSDCTLGEAVVSANTNSAIDACEAGTGADRIVVPAGTYTLTTASSGDTALPPVTSEMTIIGVGQEQTIIERADGAPLFRLLSVESGGLLSLSDVTLRRGYNGSRGGAVRVSAANSLFDRVTFDRNTAQEGGAIYASSVVTIRNSTFVENQSTAGWGGAANLAAAFIQGSMFARNSANGYGGAIHLGRGTVADSRFTDNVTPSQGGALNVGTGNVTAARLVMTGNRAGATGGAIFSGEGAFTLIDSYLSSNRANAGGGAIGTPAANGPSLTVIGSTFANNTTPNSGGAIQIYVAATIRNSTFSANSANDSGGALDISTPTDLRNVTITGNHARQYGGGLRYEWSSPAMTLANSILAGNTSDLVAYGDCYSGMPIASLGSNLVGSEWGCTIAATAGDQIGPYDAPIDPMLGLLADNGGPTPTREPALESPAVDRGNDAPPGTDPAACEGLDQRGVLRPQGDSCDVGAVEWRHRPPVISGEALSTLEDTELPLQVSATSDAGDSLAFTVVDPPAHGTIAGAFPAVTYKPLADYFGSDSFAIVASDIYGSSAPARFTIDITPVNDPPTARPDDITVLSSSGATMVAVLDNDSAFPDDGEMLTVTSVSTAAHGSVAVARDGAGVMYTPEPGFAGKDGFSYTLFDGALAATATVQVTVRPVADLRISIVSSKDPVHAGERFTYTIAIDNPGPGNAADVSAQVVIPADVTIHATAGCSSTAGGQFSLVSMDAPQLPGGTSATCAIQVSRIAAGAFTVSASIQSRSGDLDPNSANDSAAITLTNVGPLAVGVSERVAVVDEPGVTPAVVIDVAEAIAIVDVPAVRPPLVIGIVEPIAVSDEPATIPSVVIGIAEQIVVTSAPVAVPTQMVLINVAEEITVSDAAQSVEIPQADVRVAIAINPSQPVAGLATVWTLQIVNAGPAPATNLTGIMEFAGTLRYEAVPEACSFSGDRLVCSIATLASGASRAFDVTATPLGTKQVTVSASAYAVGEGDPAFDNNVASATVWAVNTTTGADVVVMPIDSTTGAALATVTFSSVTQAGQTSVTTAATGPMAPTGFMAGKPALYYDIATTARYTAPITVCLDFTGVSFAPTNKPRLFHFEGTGWVDRTTTVDFTTSIVCGVVSSLSPFALFTRDYVTTPGDMHGDGFVRQNGARYEFVFRVQEEPSSGERGRLQLRVKYDDRKRKDDAFVARDVDYVAFSDDPTVRPGRAARPNIDTVVFAGIGDWNGRPGYRFEVQAADEGEPGRHRESVSIDVVDPSGRPVARVSGTLSGGNLQSKRVHR